MRIYDRIVIDIESDTVIDYDCYEYDGIVTQCFSGGDTEKETKKITNITTKTDTDIGDIGLTGKHFVASEKLITQSLNKLIQQSGENYKRLLGGAGKIVETSKAASQDITKQAEKQSTQLLRQAGTLAERTVEDDDNIGQMMPYMLALATIILLIARR
jgi:hypothetical protein